MTACACGDCLSCETASFKARRRLPTLVADDRPAYVGEIDGAAVLLERRRANCARLPACEEAWIVAHSNAQAKCPTWCRWFEKRTERVREVRIGCSLESSIT